MDTTKTDSVAQELDAIPPGSNTTNVLDRVLFRTVRPTDIPICAQIEKDSYPPDEMASLTTLQYRQHHAARYFRCAVLPSSSTTTTTSTTLPTNSNTTNTSSNSSSTGLPRDRSNSISNNHNDTRYCSTDKSVDEDRYDDDNDQVIGFICSTRCRAFTKEAMYSQHVHDGKILAIHSVVIQEQYRRQGIASAMVRDYIRTIQYKLNPNTSLQSHPIEKIVLLSKANMLAFYVNCGFQVTRPSPIVHGKELWYELELDLPIVDPNYLPPPACYIIDAFADPNQVGTGNPAAVVLMERHWFIQKNNASNAIPTAATSKNNNCNEPTTESTLLSATIRNWMQKVANEFNLSETAFVWPYDVQDDQQPNHDDNITNHTEDDRMDVVINETTDTASSTSKETSMTDTSFTHNILRYNIRYFTPTVEVPLCGHATLASASALCQTQLLNKMNSISRSNHAELEETTIYFHTAVRDVVLSANLSSCDTSKQRRFVNITMTFPSAPPVRDITSVNEKEIIRRMLCTAFKGFDPTSILYLGLSDLGDLLVELSYDSFTKVPYNCQYGAFCDWDGYTRGVIICCCSEKSLTLHNKSLDDDVSSITTSTSVVVDESAAAMISNSSKIDFYSRFFAPKAGIDEDPVTGSAHCTLAPYYCNKLNGKVDLIGYQKSIRGGLVQCVMSDDRKQVKITGTAVNTVTGILLW